LVCKCEFGIKTPDEKTKNILKYVESIIWNYKRCVVFPSKKFITPFNQYIEADKMIYEEGLRIRDEAKIIKNGIN